MLNIIRADLERSEHQHAVVTLINAYSMDPMGNGKPLSKEVLNAMVPGLRRLPTTNIFLASVNEKFVGIAVCFLGFSTFAAKPLLNIHDLAILPEYRGQGIGRQLLTDIAREARKMGCCKLTLEVLENNHRARKLYESFGFAHVVYQKTAGGALFFSKNLLHKGEKAI